MVLPYVKAHVSAKDMETIQAVALIEVRAVEQMAANGQGSTEITEPRPYRRSVSAAWEPLG